MSTDPMLLLQALLLSFAAPVALIWLASAGEREVEEERRNRPRDEEDDPWSKWD